MDAYEEFLQSIRRDINCLSERDRNTRRNALVRLEKVLVSSRKAPVEHISRVYLGELHKPLFKLYADASEKCRELSLAMTLAFFDDAPPEDLENILPILLSALLARVRTLPFPEQSEEIRLEVLKVLNKAVDTCTTRLNQYSHDVLDGIAKALTDTCPDAKKECCNLVKKICVHFDGARISKAGGQMVSSLLGNLKHQHWKVRKATVDSLATLMAMEPMLEHMEEVAPAVGQLLIDRTPAVRQRVAEALEHWLLTGLRFKIPLVTTFDKDTDPDAPIGFDKVEPRLVYLLLSLIADEEVEQVGVVALRGLEKVAVVKHEVLQQRIAQKNAKKLDKIKGEREAQGLPPLPDDAPELQIEPDPALEVAPECDYEKLPKGLVAETVSVCGFPKPLTTTYIRSHMKSVLPQVLGNVVQWTAEIRTTASRLLTVLLLILNQQCTPMVDSVLVHLYKACADDETAVTQKVSQSASLVGTFVDLELLLDLVAKHLGVVPVNAAIKKENAKEADPWSEKVTGRTTERATAEDMGKGVNRFAAVNIENKRQVLTVLAQLLGGVSPSQNRITVADVKKILQFLEENIYADDLLPQILAVLRSLLTASGELCTSDWSRIFDICLRLRSSEACSPEDVEVCIEGLATLCGKPKGELYEIHLRERLATLLYAADTELWEENSPKRHILETLIRNSGSSVKEHLDKLIVVLARQSSADDASALARIDILGLIHFLVCNEDEELQTSLKLHSKSLLQDVLIPNCIWKAGGSNNKIRKGGMVCIHALLERSLVVPADLSESYGDLLPILKSCLDDSFSPDNRMIAALIVSAMLSNLHEVIDAEQLRDIYPDLLKRLDDSNDKIRVIICEALKSFFKCLPPGWSHSLYEYIIKTLFIHLDDPSLEIQDAVYGVLEAALHQDYNIFQREAKVAVGKSAHPRRCEELCRLAESLRLSSDVA